MIAGALDLARLENVRTVNGKTIARCPACAEAGNDEKGDHLFINAGGKFGCVSYPGADGAEHRQRIFALAVKLEKCEATRRPTRKAGPVKTWPTAEAAARACTPKEGTLEAVYLYPRNGKPFAAVGRYQLPDDKTFRQFHSTGNAWDASGPADKWPLYRFSEVSTSGAVDVFEGEKKTEAAATHGLNATTSAGGSKAATKTDWQPLAGRDVRIWPDADEPGAKYAVTVAAIVSKLNPPARVKIILLPYEIGSGKDIADYFAEGHKREELKKFIEAAPLWTPAPEPTGTTPGADPIEAASAGTPFAMSDLGNAERLVALHGENLRWDTARAVWRTWDGKRWAVDSCLNVQRMAAETARKIRKEAAEVPPSKGKADVLGQMLFNWAVKSESRERLAAMLEVAKALPGIAIQADAFDADPWKLNVLNGIIDLRTGELKPHDKAARMTKLAPVEYRPGHRDERWNKFLADATGNDSELADFLQVASGYTLTGDTSEEKLFIVYGPTAGGKSTYLEAKRGILGDYARTIQPDLLAKQRDPRSGASASPDLAGLAGARLAAGSEMEQGREIAEALAKNLTGGEPITARHLYAELFDFRPQFKLWLAVNHCPRVSADDGAIWRRILRIGFDFTVPIERRDKTLKPYLRDPEGGAPAVLAWAVEGCLRWQREGLKIPAAVSHSTEAYRAESDPLATFIEDCLTFDESAWTPWADIWTAYNEHAGEIGTVERYRVAPKRLQDKLRARGCNGERRHEGRGWLGVSVVSDWQTTGGDRDTRDARDGICQKYSMKQNIENFRQKASPPSRPSRTEPETLLFPADTDPKLRAEIDDIARHFDAVKKG